jgi:hypothetical protein
VPLFLSERSKARCGAVSELMLPKIGTIGIILNKEIFDKTSSEA